MKVVASEGLDRVPTFSPVEALTVCKRLMRTGADRCPHNKGMEGNCGHLAACCYGFSALGFTSAASAWFGAPKKYKRRGLDKMVQAPAGALVFWTGGSEKFGHVGISDGKGNILATDLPTTNRMGRFPIAQVTDRFTRLEPAGWTPPFFGNAPADNRRPPKLPGHVEDQAHERIAKRLLESQQDIIAAARRGLQHDPSPQQKEAYNDVIEETRREIRRIRDRLK
jgi:hypothetical protein